MTDVMYIIIHFRLSVEQERTKDGTALTLYHRDNDLRQTQQDVAQNVELLKRIEGKLDEQVALVKQHQTQIDSLRGINRRPRKSGSVPNLKPQKIICALEQDTGTSSNSAAEEEQRQEYSADIDLRYVHKPLFLQ